MCAKTALSRNKGLAANEGDGVTYRLPESAYIHHAMRYALGSISLLVLLLSGLAFAQDRVMMQGFYWDVQPGGVWNDTLITRAAQLGAAGFDGIWLPPPSKGAATGFDVGYTPYDYYDLGTYDSCAGNTTQGQGGCLATRYGTFASLRQAIQVLQSHGLEVYADIVLNHRSGGELEPNVYGQWFNGNGSLFGEPGVDGGPRRTYTAFPLTHGSGRNAWAVGEGNEFFYPNASNNPDNTGDFYADNQLAGFHQLYINGFGYDVALTNGFGDNLPSGDSLMVWGDWLTTTLGLDGFRFDFVKGIHPEYLKRWVNHGAMRGKFHVHELYDGDIGRLDTYYNQVLGSERPPAVFDFNQRFAYKDVLDGNAPIWRWHDSGLQNRFGFPFEAIVSFIDNHDFDRTDYLGETNQEGHSPVVSNKMLAYAHMLTHPGYAQVWWRDYYHYGLGEPIDELIRYRKAFASGDYYALTRGDIGSPFWPDANPTNPWESLYVAQRNGDGPNRGLIVAINKHPTQWAEVFVTQQNGAWIGQTLRDLTGNAGGGTTEVFSDGRVRVWAPPNSYTVWVPLSYSTPAINPAPAPDVPSYHEVDFINLQFPGDSMATAGEPVTYYARIYVHGRTQQDAADPGIEAWLGYGFDADPTTWTEWVPADFNERKQHLAEYEATLDLPPGTYYVASRFRLDGGEMVYGGFNAASGGAWDPEAAPAARLTVASVVTGEAGWRMMAPPGAMSVTDLAALNLVQGVPGFYPNADANLYTGYDGSGWTLPTSAGDPIEAGRGFIWYLFNANLNPGGASQSTALPMSMPVPEATPVADVVVSLHTSGNRFNLLGNPFGVGLDVEGMAGWEGADALSSLVPQVWDAELRSYRTAPEFGGVIAPWQGFILEASSPSSLSIPVSARRAGGTLMRPSERPVVRFELSGQNASATVRDRAAVLVFDELATDGWDRLDARKLRPLSYPNATVAFGQTGAPWIRKAQDSRPLVPDAFSVPIYVETNGFSGPATLRWEGLESLPNTWALRLLNLDTGAVLDLREHDQIELTLSAARSETPSALAVPHIEPLTATSSGPRFRLDVEPSGATSTERGSAAERLVIDGVYPNPAQGMAAVSFSLPSESPVRLAIYDVLGREMVTLVDGSFPAGMHDVRWDATGVASGVYVVRLEAGGQHVTRMLTVVR